MKALTLIVSIGMIAAGIHLRFSALVVVDAIYLTASLILIRLDVVKERSNAEAQAGTDPCVSTEGTAPSGCA